LVRRRRGPPWWGRDDLVEVRIGDVEGRNKAQHLLLVAAPKQQQAVVNAQMAAAAAGLSSPGWQISPLDGDDSGATPLDAGAPLQPPGAATRSSSMAALSLSPFDE